MSEDDLDLIILKTLITNKKQAVEFATNCDAKLFSSEYWNFANNVVAYIKAYKNIPTLKIILEKASKGPNKNLVDYMNRTWTNVDTTIVNELEYQYNLNKLKKRYAEKQISSLKDNLVSIDPGSIDVSKTVSDIQKTIKLVNNIDQVKSYESKNIKDYLSSFVDKYNYKKANPETACGLKTKYSFFDYATNGLMPADFVLIAGESGFGKSLFLNNMGVQTWMQDNTIDQIDNFTDGKNIIYFSLEMPYEDCFNRLLSKLSGVPSRSIENAKLTREEFAKIKKCLDFIKNYPYVFKIVDIADASANDLEIILSECEEKFDAVFIDYLGIMKTNESMEDQDWIKQGKISYEIRAIARKHCIPIFSAVQLNRKAANKESSENIGLGRLARSATIATHATHVIQIENRPNEESYPDFLYHIIKNRKGPKGKGVLYKELPCATLKDKPFEESQSYMDQDDISDDLEDLDLDI